MNNLYKIAQRIALLKLAAEGKKILTCYQNLTDRIYFKDDDNNLYIWVTQKSKSNYNPNKKYVVTFEVKSKRGNNSQIEVISIEDYRGQRVDQVESTDDDKKEEPAADFIPPGSILVAYLKLLSEKTPEEIMKNDKTITGVKNLLVKANNEDLANIRKECERQKIEERKGIIYYNEKIGIIYDAFITAMYSYVEGKAEGIEKKVKPLGQLLNQIKIS